MLARERRDRRLQRFAYDLAIVAHDAFTRDARMYWKMSTDLSRPLVTSMGQHDPLDGIVTYAQLRETANAIGVAAESEQLGARIVSFARMLLARVLDAAEEGLEAYALSGELDAPADHRLAFRELGLAIGLSAMPRMPRERARFERFAPIRERIVSFWRAAENRSSASYVEHRDIDDVMLVTSLVPDGALTLRPLPIARQAAHAQQ